MRPATSAYGAAHAALRVGQAAPDPAPDVDLDDGDADIADPPIAPPGLVTPPAESPVLEQRSTRDPDDDADDRDAARAPRPQRFIVTGSVIERATLTSASPVTFLRRPELLGAGRSMIGDVLQGEPEQGNALNAQFNNGGDGTTRIDLRSLDTRRTLTLLNGRRFVPAGSSVESTVDLNMIPLAIIDRVEILKDAGATVYGSDAIGGVVNIITRSDFRGTEASLYTAQNERSDGFTFDASVITGHRIGDRGHVVFSAETQRQEPVLAGDRDFSRVVNAFDFVRGVAVPTGSPSTPSGRINTREIDLNGDGRPDPINLCGVGVMFCTNDGLGGFRPFISPGDLYNFQPINYLYTPSARTSAYAAGSFPLDSKIEGFFEASFIHRTSQQQLAPEPLNTQVFGVVISRDSIFNPIGGDVFAYNRRLEEFGPRRFLQSLNTLRTVVGMRSSPTASPDAWKWELSFNYGRNDATNQEQGHLVLSRLANAIGPSFRDSSGPICGTPSAPIFGCVPMNVLGPSGSISAAARDYVGFTSLDAASNQQEIALATVQGRITQLPGGGDVSLAITADARKETGEFTPDALVASGDTTGIVKPAISASTRVAEAAAELQIVPVRDRDGVERIEVDLATRAFHYDTFGDGMVSSARALIRPIRHVTLRASRSDSFRAPSIPELFEAQADSFPFGFDPCDNAFGPPSPSAAAECAREGVPAGSIFGTSQQRTVVGGNPKVQPETAQVMSAGVVLEAPVLTGLSLSVDWWSIEVTQAIQSPPLETVFASCYERGLRNFCDLVHRDPVTHAISFVDGTFQNIGGTTTSGVDAALNFDRRTRAGDLHARLDVQDLRSFDIDTGAGIVLHGLGVYDLGIHPRRKVAASAQWSHPQGLSAGFAFHFIDSFTECQNNNCNDPTSPSRTVDSYSKLDVFSSISLGGRRTPATTVTVGVNNVFDRAPPVIYTAIAGNYDSSTYDQLGRFAYLRVNQAF